MADMEETFSHLAQPESKLPRFRNSADGFNRQKVVAAFHEAFQLIGGVNRLTMWANANPGEFYKLYTKLMPASTINIGVGERVIIEHAIGPTALDVHPTDVIENENASNQESVQAPQLHEGLPPQE